MEYYIDPVEFILQKQGGEASTVRNLLRLLDEGATIPFIARYRKEQTGSMDEVRIGEVQTTYVQFQELEKRKASVLEAIRGQEKLTAELERQIRTWTESRVL
ncbi:MAG: RNA-binding transcriptional accessory protein, partial [Odoribacter sp.]|nr:RNA-binding transcriptional accessory protein [Odoribacter sp.]